MLKGDFNVVVGAVIVVGFFVFIIMGMRTGLVQTEAFIYKGQEKVNAVDIAHLVKSCLEEDGRISIETIESVRQPIETHCNLGISPFVRITVVGDSSRIWYFGEYGDGASHDIYFSLIEENGKNVMGKIHVNI